jgi:hypothetical protein
MFASLENSDAEVHINRAWETIGKNIQISVRESLGYNESIGLMRDAQIIELE